MKKIRAMWEDLARDPVRLVACVTFVLLVVYLGQLRHRARLLRAETKLLRYKADELDRGVARLEAVVKRITAPAPKPPEQKWKEVPTGFATPLGDGTWKVGTMRLPENGTSEVARWSVRAGWTFVPTRCPPHEPLAGSLWFQAGKNGKGVVAAHYYDGRAWKRMLAW